MSIILSVLLLGLFCASIAIILLYAYLREVEVFFYALKKDFENYRQAQNSQKKTIKIDLDK